MALLLPSWQGGAGGGRACMAQAINIGAAIPSYMDVTGLAPDEVRHMVHEFTVDVPSASGTVSVHMGMAEGDTSIMVRNYPLGTQQWPDSTWVAPVAGGHRIGLGRFTGLDAIWVEVSSGGNVIGAGTWERP